MPDDPFASPKLKLTRAKKNRDDFISERGRFFNEHPWTQIEDASPDGFSKHFKVKLTRPFPDIFSELISYATNNLRSCLDGSTWVASICAGRQGKNAPFPFGETPEALENSIKGRCKDVPPNVLAVARGFKPYKTGNALLWAINHVANLDKHAIVIPMAASLSTLIFYGVLPAGSTAITFPWNPVFTTSAALWRPEDNVVEYSIRASDPGTEINANYNSNITLDIAFGKIEIVGGQRAITVLNSMVNEVEQILVAIEAETRRLFPGAF